MSDDWPAVRLEPGQVLAVRKWREVFEKSDAKKLKHLTWVSTPTSFGSNGLQRLFDDFTPAEAIQLYGVWCFLVKVAATSSDRGRLGGSQGKPYSVSALSRLMMGVPVDLVERLISWCVHRSGWLEIVQVGVVHESPPTPVLPPENRLSENLGKSPDYRTGPDRTQPDISGRPVRPPDRRCLNELAETVKAALRAKALTADGRTAVYRFAIWLEQFDEHQRELMTDEITALLRSERPSKWWRFLFATCRSRDRDPETFALRWDAAVYVSEAAEPVISEVAT